MKEKIYQNYRSANSSKKNIKRNSHIKSLFFQFDKNFSSFLPNEKTIKIVDIGCGGGELVAWLNKRGYKNTSGYDLSQEQINIAKETFEIDVYCEDILSPEIKFPEADIYFLRDVLEHFDKRSIEILFNSLKKTNSRDIKLIVQTLNGATPTGIVNFYSDITHENCFTERSITQLFSSNFNTTIKFKSWYAYGTSISSRIKVSISKVLIMLRKIIYGLEIGHGNKIYTANIISEIKINFGEENG